MNALRRLLVLLDGTWNEDAAYDQDTNIVRLRDLISRELRSSFRAPLSIREVDAHDPGSLDVGAYPYYGCEYFIFYERGVGTGPGLDRLTGGAFGTGLDQNVRRAYKFLSQNYVPGAEIFVFGFSRGAYTARSLVGLLGSAGLLRADNCQPELEKEVWQYYRTPPNDRFPGIRRKLERYIHSTSELRVACLGVFDTVGALGIPLDVFWRLNREEHGFHDVLVSPIVKLNLHALAIDERRLQFEASVWRQSKFRTSNSVIEQTWFPGVHADVGGGYFSDEERLRAPRCLDDVTLDWMVKRVRHHYSDFPITAGFVPLPGPAAPPSLQHNSRTGMYRLFSPAVRAIGNLPPQLVGRERLVSYDRDQSVIGEAVHISAIERLGEVVETRPGNEGCYYLPRNLIENLPNLWERYCAAPERAWGSEP